MINDLNDYQTYIHRVHCKNRIVKITNVLVSAVARMLVGCSGYIHLISYSYFACTNYIKICKRYMYQLFIINYHAEYLYIRCTKRFGNLH